MAGVLVLCWTQFQSRFNFGATQSSTFHPKCKFSFYNFVVIGKKTSKDYESPLGSLTRSVKAMLNFLDLLLTKLVQFIHKVLSLNILPSILLHMCLINTVYQASVAFSRSKISKDPIVIISIITIYAHDDSQCPYRSNVRLEYPAAGPDCHEPPEMGIVCAQISFFFYRRWR